MNRGIGLVTIGTLAGLGLLVSQTAASRGTQSQDRSNVSPARLIGHRGFGCSIPGCSSDVPENSMAAFRKGFQSGKLARMELDTWLTEDGEVLVIHGGGGDSGGVIDEVVVNSKGIQIEKMTYNELEKADALTLRESWSVLEAKATGKSPEQVAQEYAKFSSSKQKEAIAKYTEDPTRSSEKIPKLDDLFEELCPQMIEKGQAFQVELKGSKDDLGPRIIEIAKKFRGCIGGFSSFQWTDKPSICSDPKLAKTASADECPNGYIHADVLKPLIGNELGIPLCLLYNANGLALPSKDRLQESMKLYNAAEAHLRHDFYHLKKGGASWPTDTSAIAEVLAVVHDIGGKVMFWTTGHHFDTDSEIKTSVYNGPLDFLCTNNVERAATIVSQDAGVVDERKQ